MTISCKMAEDLLPLYLEDSCSEDSRAALEEHLSRCPSCCAKRERMQRSPGEGLPPGDAAPRLASYAKKVRGHRIRFAVSAVFIIAAASAVLALLYLTLADMRRQAAPQIHEVEPGTCNLTAGPLTVGAEEIGQYVFYTNYARIQVSVQGAEDLQGTVMLWNAAEDGTFIQICRADGREPVCTFTGLSSSCRYRITCEQLDGAELTVSEGRTVRFWDSLGTVLRNIAGLLGG